MINEHKKGVKAMKYTAKPKPANPVAKHAGSTTTSSAGAHYQGQDQKKKAKHGEVKHKNKAMDLSEDQHNPEYDDEAGMADNNLETLKRAVDGIDDVINQGDNLPEWCQEKIAVAKSMLVTVWDYMLSEKNSEVMEEKKGLYYYVNKRKKAGTSRSKNHPDAPSAQDWKNAAKTAKKESVSEGYNMGGLLPGKYYLHSIYMDSKVFTDPQSGEPMAFASSDDAESFRNGMSGREVDEYQVSVFNKGQLQPVDENISEGSGATIASLDAVFNEYDFDRLESIWPALEAGDKKEALRQINHYLNRGKNRAWWGDLQALDIKIDINDVENSQVMWSKPIKSDVDEGGAIMPLKNKDGLGQGEWIEKVKAKYPDAQFIGAKMPNGNIIAMLPDGRQIVWKAVVPGTNNPIPRSATKMSEEKVKGVDGKACWKGKRYAGKVKKADGTYKDKCVPMESNWYELRLQTLLNEQIKK